MGLSDHAINALVALLKARKGLAAGVYKQGVEPLQELLENQLRAFKEGRLFGAGVELAITNPLEYLEREDGRGYRLFESEGQPLFKEIRSYWKEVERHLKAIERVDDHALNDQDFTAVVMQEIEKWNNSHAREPDAVIVINIQRVPDVIRTCLRVIYGETHLGNYTTFWNKARETVTNALANHPRRKPHWLTATQARTQAVNKLETLVKGIQKLELKLNKAGLIEN